MRRLARLALGMLGLVFLTALALWLVPPPALEDTRPPRQLADPDSLFVDVQGLNVHYKQAGSGEPAMLLLHGFGASLFSWRDVLTPLGAFGLTVAYDRPAFGLTERPLPGSWVGASPYGQQAQSELVVQLMDALGIDRAVLIGNSAGGTIATLTALRHPERVQALVLVDPALLQGQGGPAWGRGLASLPGSEQVGRRLARLFLSQGDRLIDQAWHDPQKITSEVRLGYARPLQAQDWDLAFWELVKATEPLTLEDDLAGLALPTLVITGEDDRIVSPEDSRRVADIIPGARFVSIPACGHLPQEECPEAFLQAVASFLEALP